MRRGRAKYEEFWALQDVSLEVPTGSTFGLIGENGSGKSTLLKCMARILRPDKGRTDVKGKVSALLELGAGFHPELSGRENVYLNGSILGLSKKELDAKFDDIVDFAGLERFIDTPVKNYSSGMYVRLGFSVAINVDPDVLLVDEILAVGDENFQRKCAEKFADLRDAGQDDRGRQPRARLGAHAVRPGRLARARRAQAGRPAAEVIDNYVGRHARRPRRRRDRRHAVGLGRGPHRAGRAARRRRATPACGPHRRAVTFRLPLRDHEPIERPVFGIGDPRPSTGQPSPAPNTREVGRCPEKIDGKGIVDLVDRPPAAAARHLRRHGVAVRLQRARTPTTTGARAALRRRARRARRSSTGCIALDGHWTHRRRARRGLP